jgi:hypothetical protein
MVRSGNGADSQEEEVEDKVQGYGTKVEERGEHPPQLSAERDTGVREEVFSRDTGRILRRASPGHF